MSSGLFFLLLVIYCTLFVSANYVSGDQDQAANKKDVNLFKSSQKYENLISESVPDSGVDNSITFDDFYSPFILATKDEIIVLTGANCSKHSDKISVLARYIKTEEITELFTTNEEGTASKWEKQIALKQVEQEDKKILKFLFAAINKKKKIYIFLVNIDKQEASESGPQPKWDFSIITGTIDPSASKINWEAEASQGSSEFPELKKKLEDNTPSNGFVLLTEAGNFIIALQFEKKTDNKIPFAFIQFKDTGITETSADLEVKEDDCKFKLFAWKEKIMLAKYSDGSNSMYELQKEKKTTWINTDEPISFLLPYLKNGNSFIAAKIDSLSVLLFLQKPNSCTDEKKNCINLWITDGFRLFDVGTIVTDGDKVTFAGLLYTKEKLFLLHRQAEEGQKPKSIVFTHLDKELKEINVILKKWKDSNEKIQQLYKDTATGATLLSTDGLVGFLFGTDKDGNRKWMNGYFNVDATLQEDSAKRQKTENGFKFCGEGAGAKWQTEQKEKKQLYNFINSGFTFVATVIIGKNTNTKNNSILGVVLTGVSPKNVGLWCTTNGKWGVSGVNSQTGIQPSLVNCTPNKIYYVAVILNNNDKKLSVYVNGAQLQNSQNKVIEITISENIEHFYFGADSDTKTSPNTESHVTIANVLLYNRPFSEQLKHLKPQEDEADNQAFPQGTNDEIPKPDGSTEQIDGSLNTPPNTKDKEEKTQPSPPPPTTEDSAARVGDVGVLCFMLFGVFTLLGRYVY